MDSNPPRFTGESEIVDSMAISEQEELIVSVVRQWVVDEVRPVVRELEASDTYPAGLIEDMCRLGVFGLLVPEEFGGAGVSARCFAMVTEELSRGWMSLAGAMGSHSVVATLIKQFGTVEQQERYLPRMAGGEVRAAMALTEPGGGSDLQAMSTHARLKDGVYIVNGSKAWITNALRASLIALLVKTDRGAEPPYRGISILLAEKGEGLVVSKPMAKLGYKGVESCMISLDDYSTPTSSVLGDVPGEGFVQMMKGLEVGRIQVAARALGVARAAYEEALEYAQNRVAFGKPIWMHQAIGNYLADMATGIEAARGLIVRASDLYDRGERCDVEAGMAKLFASELCKDVVFDAMRIFGAYGYSPEYNIERYYRDAPLMVIGEGTNEIQRNVMVRELVRRNSRD